MYQCDTDNPDWAAIVTSLKTKGVKVSDIAKAIGSTTPHVYMIMNGKRGANLNYTTGIKLIKLFKEQL